MCRGPCRQGETVLMNFLSELVGYCTLSGIARGLLMALQRLEAWCTWSAHVTEHVTQGQNRVREGSLGATCF